MLVMILMPYPKVLDAGAFPRMNREEFKNLVASIKQHGLLEPVVKTSLTNR